MTVSDTLGNLRLHDIRKDCKTIGNFRGFSGAIRSVAYHPTEPLLAAVGLDRFLHICNTTNRKHVAKVYLKQRMNHVLWAPAAPVTTPEVSSIEDGEESFAGSYESGDESLSDESGMDSSIEEESTQMDED